MHAAGTDPPQDAQRARIVKAARRHFLLRGFRGVTMDDLAAELGMSKKTLYACFSSKSTLLEAVLRDKLDSVEADLHAVSAERQVDFVDTLHHLLSCLQRHTEEIQPPFLHDLQREAPEMFELVQARRHELIERYFGELLARGRRAGVLRKDIPPALTLEVLLAAAQRILNPPKLLELQLTPKTALPAILTIIFEGIITDKGRARL